jgi:hypothetical protein
MSGLTNGATENHWLATKELAMMSRVTGEVSFRSGLHILPHRAIETSHKSQVLPLKGWKRHILGSHDSEHGAFEVEALSKDRDRIQVVLLAHQHSFYEPGTPSDADRRAFHEGVISLELGGQREFSWGEVVCRLEAASNKDWLVVAYNRDADVPLGEKEVLLRLLVHEEIPDESD